RVPPDRGRGGLCMGGYRSLEERRKVCRRHRPLHEKRPSVSGPGPAPQARGPRSVLGRVQPSSCRGGLLSPPSPRTRRLGGVYLVASPQKPVSRLWAIVTAALEGGVSTVQLRDKGVYSTEVWT